MKKQLVLVVLIALILFAVSFSQQSTQLTYFNKAQVGYRINRLTLGVDARIELLTVMQVLCDYWLINRDSSTYLNSINSYFAKYKEHRLINLIKSMYNKGITAEVPYKVMLSLNYDFKPDSLLISPSYKYIHKNIDTVNLYIDAIQNFVQETKFYDFFNNSIEYYDNILKQQINEIGNFDEVTTLEQFYGSRQDNYYIMLVPLDYASYGISVEKKSGEDNAYFLSGIGKTKGIGILSKLEFSELFWHEFGHTFVNPVTYKYQDLVDKYAHYYEAISEVRNEGYKWWTSALNEQIIRAAGVFFTENKFGNDEAQKKLRKEERTNFYYTNGIYNALKYYDNNRSIYKNYEEYFPELLKSFDTINIGNVKDNFIPTLRYFEIDSSIVIIPSNVDKSLQKNTYDYINTYYNQNLKDKNSSILVDTVALKSDLSKNNLIVFGSPSSNKWLGENLKRLPFLLSDSQIVSSKINEGKHLRFVSTWKNPQNPKKNIVICAALNLSDIIGIDNWIPGYGVNYAIFNNNELIDYGNYMKQENKWVIESK